MQQKLFIQIVPVINSAEYLWHMNMRLFRLVYLPSKQLHVMICI